MLHTEEGANNIYVYSTKTDLTTFEISLERRTGRTLEEVTLPLNVIYFGNSFYQLELNLASGELTPTEYYYSIKANGEEIDNGFLRYNN